MFKNLKRELYFAKMALIYEKGLTEGSIVPFDDEFMEHLNNKFFNGVPVSMHMKYLKPIMPPGQCYDRSFYMFCCFDDVLLVQGDNKDLELRYGKDHAWHAWIERGDYVYDPSIMKRFDKDLYYKMFMPKNIVKRAKEEYCSSEESKKIYDSIADSKVEDYMPNGKNRTSLLVSLPLVMGIADVEGNEEMKKELDAWLERIDYDPEQIHNQAEVERRSILNSKAKKHKLNIRF